MPGDPTSEAAREAGGAGQAEHRPDRGLQTGACPSPPMNALSGRWPFHAVPRCVLRDQGDWCGASQAVPLSLCQEEAQEGPAHISGHGAPLTAGLPSGSTGLAPPRPCDRLLPPLLLRTACLGSGFWRPRCASRFLPAGGARVCTGVCSHMGERRDVCRGVCWWEGSGTSRRHRPSSPEPKAWPQACLSLAQLALRGRTQGQERGRWGVPAGPGRAEAPAVRGLRRGTAMGLAEAEVPRGGQTPATLSWAPGFLLPGWGGGGGGGSAYLYHGGWVLKAWSHGWQGPAAGHSSGAPSGSGPRAYLACSSKRHSEEDLKGEGSGRAGRPRAPGTFQGPQEAGKTAEGPPWTSP